MDERSQTRGEEIANTISHAVGLAAAVVATPILIISALATDRGPAGVAAVSIFGATMVVLYLASTLYHSWPTGPAKQYLRRLDHVAIYLLIAGTYTPFTLGALRGPWGWSLFGVIWGVAAAGVMLKMVGEIGMRFPRSSTVLYLVMGWLITIAVVPLVTNVPFAGLGWLVGGGLAYSLGVAFYAAKRLRYAHFVWHIFVMTGTTCHFFAVLWYSM